MNSCYGYPFVWVMLIGNEVVVDHVVLAISVSKYLDRVPIDVDLKYVNGLHELQSINICLILITLNWVNYMLSTYQTK